MLKFIIAYRKNPSDLNALKLARHVKKHPMAVCMLCPEEIATLNEAYAQLAPHAEMLKEFV